MTKRRNICIALDDEIVEVVDDRRNVMPRSAFLRMLIERGLETGTRVRLEVPQK